jgi:hypothetical protein
MLALARCIITFESDEQTDRTGEILDIVHHQPELDTDAVSVSYSSEFNPFIFA